MAYSKEDSDVATPVVATPPPPQVTVDEVMEAFDALPPDQQEKLMEHFYRIYGSS